MKNQLLNVLNEEFNKYKLAFFDGSQYTLQASLEYEYTASNNGTMDGVVIVAASLAIIYLVANDATGIGVADDVAIPPLAAIIWDTATKLA